MHNANRTSLAPGQAAIACRRWEHLLSVLTLAMALILGAPGLSVAASENPDRTTATDRAAAGTHRGFKGLHETLGPRYEPNRQARPAPSRLGNVPAGLTTWIRHWNEVCIDTSGLDHTPVASGETRVFGEQFGPCRASRAMAIAHIAMFDAVNAIAGGYKGYTGIRAVPHWASMRAAAAQAAHDALVALFPSQAPQLHAQLAGELRQIPPGQAKNAGISAGRSAAAAILALRKNDGSSRAEPLIGVNYFPSNEPGHWRQDPVSLSPLALGAYWKEVRPFVLRSASQFRTPPPPALQSAAYASAFNEVKVLGGDGVTTPTIRTDEQAFIGFFWAYDGTPSLCAPPRLYNQIAAQIAEARGTEGMELCRLFALINVAMADAAIAIWESKYHFDLWRPVTGIREADPRTGPTGKGDRNPGTKGDVTFTPLGAPASNLSGPNFTPPFPSYPSGHAGFGGALFQVLRRFYGTDDIAFTFVSDEYNGVTVDNEGNVRPYLPRSYDSLSEAEDENGQSRIYLGIHWRFDKTRGIAQGRQVGNYVVDRVFRPQH